MFLLDMALVLARQKTQHPLDDRVRMILADSSPQLGRNWFWVQETLIKRNDLIKLLYAYQLLVMAMRQAVASLATAKVDSVFSALLQDDSLLESSVALSTGLSIHTYTPVALGKTQGDVAGKCQALAHMMGLEQKEPVSVRRSLAEVCAVCSDMGVEMHLADFPVSTQPFWMSEAPVAADHLEVGLASLDGEDGAASPTPCVEALEVGLQESLSDDDARPLEAGVQENLSDDHAVEHGQAAP